MNNLIARCKKFIFAGGLLVAAIALLLPAVAAGAVEDTGGISGAVTNGGQALADIRVDAYASIADYNNGLNGNAAATAVTEPDGTYVMEGLPAGNYLIVFNQGGGGNNSAYATDFYNNQSSIGGAQFVVVIAGATTPDISATLTAPGQITGKVTNTLGVGLPNILVDVYASVADYQNGILAAGYHAVQDGTYQIGGLHEGSYIVAFNEPITMMYQANYETEFYNAQTSIATANTVVVTAGSATNNIDATLTALAPTNKSQCKKGGWRLFTAPSFQNQGQCVSYAEHHN